MVSYVAWVYYLTKSAKYTKFSTMGSRISWFTLDPKFSFLTARFLSRCSVLLLTAAGYVCLNKRGCHGKQIEERQSS